MTRLAGALPYGLISGWRRLMALKALHAETNKSRLRHRQGAGLPTLDRPPRPTSSWSKRMSCGLASATTSARGSRRAPRRAASSQAAGGAPRAVRAGLAARGARIRAFLELYHALDASLRFPAALPERLGLQLVQRVRAGDGGRIAQAITRADPQTPEEELALLTTLAWAAPPKPPAPEHILPDVSLAATLRGRTLTLRLTGAGVTRRCATRRRRCCAD